MEKDKIAQLLEKYWNAETTVEEEKLIKAYFKEHGRGKNWEESNRWFKTIENAQLIQPVSTDNDSYKPVRSGRLFNISIILKIAAMVILICGITILGINNYRQRQQAKKEQELKNILEADLNIMFNAFDEGTNSLDQSAGLMSETKTIK